MNFEENVPNASIGFQVTLKSTELDNLKKEVASLKAQLRVEFVSQLSVEGEFRFRLINKIAAPVTVSLDGLSAMELLPGGGSQGTGIGVPVTVELDASEDKQVAVPFEYVTAGHFCTIEGMVLERYGHTQ